MPSETTSVTTPTADKSLADADTTCRQVYRTERWQTSELDAAGPNPVVTTAAHFTSRQMGWLPLSRCYCARLRAGC